MYEQSGFCLACGSSIAQEGVGSERVEIPSVHPGEGGIDARAVRAADVGTVFFWSASPRATAKRWGIQQVEIDIESLCVESARTKRELALWTVVGIVAQRYLYLNTCNGGKE